MPSDQIDAAEKSPVQHIIERLNVISIDQIAREQLRTRIAFGEIQKRNRRIRHHRTVADQYRKFTLRRQTPMRRSPIGKRRKIKPSDRVVKTQLLEADEELQCRRIGASVELKHDPPRSSDCRYF